MRPNLTPLAFASAQPRAVLSAMRPEEECAAFASRSNDHTEREIQVGAYGLTTSSGIVELGTDESEDALDRSFKKGPI